MKDSIYWIGIKQSDLDDVDGIFNKSITFFGVNDDTNCSYSYMSQKRINHNHDNSSVSQFIANQINNILLNDPKACFMYFSPYHAYYLPEELQDRVYCKNSISILELLRNKISTRFWVANFVPIVPSLLVDGKHCTYDFLKGRFNSKYNKFVVQKNYSAGGYSTFVLAKETMTDFGDGILLASPYIENSFPINVTLIIYESDILVFPPSLQIVVNDSGRLLYKGADFIAYQDVPTDMKQKVVEYSNKIGKYLQNTGYRGICGIDFICDSEDVYFMEVNERFQASTYLINMALKKVCLPSMQELCIEAFHSKAPTISLENFTIPYSNYIYTYHKEFAPCYQFIYNKAKQNKHIVRIVDDGFLQNEIPEKDAYLFAIVTDINIVSINYDNNLNIDDHIREHLPLNKNDILKVKIHLMNQGLFITDNAQQFILKKGNIRVAINAGLDLTIFENIKVNCIYGDHRLLNMTPFELDVKNEELTLMHYQNLICKASYDLKDPMALKRTTSGVPYANIAFLANRRLQINHETICFYKKNEISCKFCGLKNTENYFERKDIYEVIDDYISNNEFDSFLIGGASNSYLHGWNIIIDIAGYISVNSKKPIYLMVPPPPEKQILAELKKAGITEVSFNIEMFDRKIAQKLMPGKGKISLDLYLDMLTEAVSIWGKNGNVRSMLIVGLESTSSLLNGVKYLAEHGIQPILSPFGPRSDTSLKNKIPFSSEKLVDIYNECVAICQQFDLLPGPDNIPCQNNTLSIPKKYLI